MGVSHPTTRTKSFLNANVHIMQNIIDENLRAIHANMVRYNQSSFGRVAGRIALRFINTNFRNQGWAGPPNMRWHPRRKSAWGKKDKGRGRAILVNGGHLRNSFTATPANGQVIIASNIPYAKVHNEGFHGKVTQTVPAHQRKKTVAGITKVKTLKTKSNIEWGRKDTGNTISVKGYKRTINQRIPRRQFMPTATRPSAELNRQITRQVTLDIMKILKGK